ncbi:MAG: hypothetical protein ABI664_08545 [bacterium]
MSTEQEKSAQAKIDDLPEPASADREAEKVKGGQRNLRATETGDVTPGPNGGDTG